MHIDIFSSIIFNMVSSFFMGLSLFLVTRGYLGEIHGIKRWSLGLIFQFIGWTIGALSKVLPEMTVLAPLSTSTLMLAVAFYFHALVEFKEINVPVKRVYYLVALAALILIALCLAEFELSIRILIATLFSMYLLNWSAYLLLAERYQTEIEIPLSHKITAYTFVLIAVAMLIRAIYFIVVPPGESGLFTVNFIQDITYLSFHLVISLTSFSFLMMCSDKYVFLQKQGLIQLQASEERYRKVIDILPVPIVLYHGENLVLLNQAFSQTFGYELADIPTVNAWREKAYPDAFYRQCVVETWIKTKNHATGESNTVYMPHEVVVCCKDGGEKTVLASASTLTAIVDGLSLAVLHDITQRKQDEQALQESEFRWKFAIEGSGDGIWDWNVKTGKVYFSKRWKEMLSFSEHEISDKLTEWESRIHPDDKEETLNAVQAYFEGKSPFYINEHRVRCKGGNYKWILDRGMVVHRDENGLPLRMIGTHTDISKQKHTEDALQQLVNQERCSRIEQSQFMAMLAKELKTPLSLIHKALDTENVDAEISLQAKCAVRDIDNIIARCLQSEKITDQELTFHLIDCDLIDTVEHLRASIQTMDRLEIDMQFVPLLHTDVQLLSTILFNLIDNALKYSPPESVVVIEAHPENLGVSIGIKNLIGAAGYPDKDKVFQKYYRSKAAHHPTGSGLGLYLVKTMIILLGGEVSYQHDDTHVTFKLWLPFSTKQLN